MLYCYPSCLWILHLKSLNNLHKNLYINFRTLSCVLYDDSIVIRPSDNSSGVVIMNRSDYETEVHDELKDNGTYKEIKEDLTTKN